MMGHATPATRLAGPDDAAVLAALHRQDAGRPWSEEEFATLLSTVGIGGLIACSQDGAAIGFVLVRQLGPEAEILALLVDQASRRRGIACGLMTAAIAGLNARGVRSLFLEVAEDNAPAMSLYAKMRFADVGRRPNYYLRPGGLKVAARNLRLDLRGR